MNGGKTSSLKKGLKEEDLNVKSNNSKLSEANSPKTVIPYLLIFVFSIGIYGLPSLSSSYANYMSIYYTGHYGIGAYIINISLTLTNIIGLYAALFAGLKVENLTAKEKRKIHLYMQITCI